MSRLSLSIQRLEKSYCIYGFSPKLSCDMSEELLSTEQAAERMGRSVQWIQYLIKHNKLPALRIGRTYVIKASDVDSYEHQPRGKPPAGANNSTKASVRLASSRRAKQARASSR
jgi:excisionase family DNA binding protein